MNEAKEKKVGGKKPLSLRLDAETLARMQRIAEVNGLRLTEVARIALREMVPVIERDGIVLKPAA